MAKQLLAFYFFVLSFPDILYAQRKLPYTGKEYVSCLGYGFDTDFFKESPPLRRYNNQNNILMDNLKKIGVKHLRLRSRADLFGFETKQYNADSMNLYLNSLLVVLNDMIHSGIFPIISWIHQVAEVSVSEEDGKNYVFWWKKLAEKTTSITYELSFNLFTEIDDGPLRNPDTYNNWTKGAIAAIRATGGYNKDRILILGAPGKKPETLNYVDPSIYENMNNLAAEWHLYASGPNKDGGQKNWVGNGSTSDRLNVDSIMDTALKFTNSKNVPTWIGAWMPYDNIGASQNQSEVEAFGCYFASAAFKRGIPWAMNKLDNFYDTEKNIFLKIELIGKGDAQLALDMPRILNASLCAFELPVNSNNSIGNSSASNVTDNATNTTVDTTNSTNSTNSINSTNSTRDVIRTDSQNSTSSDNSTTINTNSTNSPNSTNNTNRNNSNDNSTNTIANWSEANHKRIKVLFLPILIIVLLY